VPCTFAQGGVDEARAAVLRGFFNGDKVPYSSTRSLARWKYSLEVRLG
jgi:hypothetical protein